MQSVETPSSANVAIYARVGKPTQRRDLANQVKRLRAYCLQEWGVAVPDSAVFAEVGPVMDQKLAERNRALFESPQLSHVVVEHTDRVARSNFSLLNRALGLSGKTIVVANPGFSYAKSEEEEWKAYTFNMLARELGGRSRQGRSSLG